MISRAQDEPDLTIAILVVRRGAILRFFVGGAVAGDPLTELTHIAEAVVDREPGGAATPVSSEGLRTGGLWDLLPRLADLPEGFIRQHERVPEPFAPLPRQGTPEP